MASERSAHPADPAAHPSGTATNIPGPIPFTPPHAPLAPLPFRHVVLRQIQPAETHTALRLILSSFQAPADDTRVVDFVRYAMARKIDLTRIGVVDRDGILSYAILPLPAGGRCMLVLTPSTPVPVGQPCTPDDLAAAAKLIEHVLAGYPDALLAQALVDPHSPQAADVLHWAGFQNLARLEYLQRALTGTPVSPKPPGQFSVHTYSGATHALFRRAIEESYVDSLDCPALNGRRDLDDVIDGHKCSGDFRPDLWRVLTTPGGPGPQPRIAAILLLNPTGNGESMELVYLGVTKPFRGQGLGHWAVQTSLYETYRNGLTKLTLAVDAANRPALKLYHRFGMRRIHERFVLIRGFQK